VFQVRQNLPDHRRILHAGDDPHLAAAALAALDASQRWSHFGASTYRGAMVAMAECSAVAASSSSPNSLEEFSTTGLRTTKVNRALNPGYSRQRSLKSLS
jgi:hypothetical protein